MDCCAAHQASHRIRIGGEVACARPALRSMPPLPGPTGRVQPGARPPAPSVVPVWERLERIVRVLGPRSRRRQGSFALTFCLQRPEPVSGRRATWSGSEWPPARPSLAPWIRRLTGSSQLLNPAVGDLPGNRVVLGDPRRTPRLPVRDGEVGRHVAYVLTDASGRHLVRRRRRPPSGDWLRRFVSFYVVSVNDV